VFNQEFEEMNTAIHFLTLFLHLLCKNLALSDTILTRSFKAFLKTALQIAATNWSWPEASCDQLIMNMTDYYHGKAPFVGASHDALGWWQNLGISADACPLKALAITLHRIVPHSAEVECLFSNLGGIQDVKRSNLAVEMLETLRKLCGYYVSERQTELRTQGKSVCHQHAHMHTKSQPGINAELATSLAVNEGKATAEAVDKDSSAMSSEEVLEEDMEKEFQMISKELNEIGKSPDPGF
jgi:hypothetical protein